MTKKKIFFIKSRLSPSLCFPSRAVFPAGWRKDMRVPGVLHRALHNKPSVENKMPQTRIILIKSWNQSCVKIWGRWVVSTGEMGSGAWEVQARTWGEVSRVSEVRLGYSHGWPGLFLPPKHLSPISWWYFGQALQWHGEIFPVWWGEHPFHTCGANLTNPEALALGHDRQIFVMF